jgi:hypothetical protein
MIDAAHAGDVSGHGFFLALPWLHNSDIKPNVAGIQDMQRLLALTNPKVKSVKVEDVVDETP